MIVANPLQYFYFTSGTYNSYTPGPPIWTVVEGGFSLNYDLSTAFPHILLPGNEWYRIVELEAVFTSTNRAPLTNAHGSIAGQSVTIYDEFQGTGSSPRSIAVANLEGVIHSSGRYPLLDAELNSSNLYSSLDETGTLSFNSFILEIPDPPPPSAFWTDYTLTREDPI